MANETLSRIMDSVPFRLAGELHQKLQSKESITPQTRQIVHQALRKAGMVTKSA